MSIQEVIEEKLNNEFQPVYLVVENESHMHGGPATESHFKLTVVSEIFNGMMLIKRHREIYRVLAEELSGDVHALALHTYTPAQWQEREEDVPESPNCRGGSKPG
ncbi:MAG: BolA/IbaG family iron-sulfur metabolism protein [Gammaproteobacteria bacterium]|nr:BolA/IbaG family iron-sulfur metabolism protein [Gammaproteobacteria bacterium]